LEKFKPLVNTEEDLYYKNYNLPNPKERPWILTLGRLSFAAAHKGYERLIEVFAEVAEKEEKSILVFAGKGDMVNHLKELASKFKVSNRVYFSGMVHEDDLPKFYWSAHVFSLVSDRGVGRGEGIPLTPLEAMACGTPIIVGNQDGSQEAVVDNQNGFCISTFDLEQHQQAILSLLTKENLHQQMAAASIKIAREHFSYEGFKNKHILFLNCLND
jgi:phosphatidylinositol alpha-1,6-mannosyltransferase